MSFNLSTEPGALSPVLSEALLLVRHGLSNREIAERLGVSLAAAEHRVAKLRRLGCAIEWRRRTIDGDRRKSEAGKKGMASRWGKLG